jgi:microcompartment protein CcmK/EutM
MSRATDCIGNDCTGIDCMLIATALIDREVGLAMDIGRVVGQVVATVKQPGLQGRTLLLIVPVDLADVEKNGPERYVAADYVGAGLGEVVLVSRGSAARVDDSASAVPTDAAAVAIIDTVVVDNKTVFRKSG